MPLKYRALHLTALWTIVFVQPLFDLLGKTEGFFVARGNTTAEIFVLALGWTFGPPLVMTALVAVAGPARQPLHLAFMGAMAVVLWLQPLGIPLAVALGGGLTLLYARAAPLRTFVSFLGLAPPVVLALFLLSAPVRDVLSAPEPDPAKVRIDNPAPVVVLVFDELPTLTLMQRDRSLDARRFPNFARLANASTWYPNATSVSDGTYVAVPAILTGDAPPADIPPARAYDESLFTLLGATHDLHVHEPMTVVCPPKLCGARDRAAGGLRTLIDDLWVVERRLLYPDDLADDLPAIDRDVAGFAPGSDTELADSRLRGARATTRTIERGDRPGLWFIHHVVPHVPWKFLADGTTYSTGDGPSIPGLEDQTWTDNRFLIDQSRDRHVQATRFADRLLGDTIDRLQRSDLWDDALVIVVADHGVAFGPGQSRRPVTEANFAQVAGVPFFVKAPNQRAGGTDDRFVTTLDVVPTVAKTLQARTDFTFDGVPVDEDRPEAPLRQRNGREAAFVEQTPLRFTSAFDARLSRRDPPQVRTEGRRRPIEATFETDGAFLTGTTEDVAPGTDLIAVQGSRIIAAGEAYDGRFSFFLHQPTTGPVEVFAVE